MAKNVKRIILSEKQPRNRHIAWAKPEGDNINLKIFEDSKWKPIAGSVNSTDTSNAINIDSIQNLDPYYYATEVRGFTDEYLDSMSPEEGDKLMAEFINWLDSATFISEKHGTATYNKEARVFICEDGYGITQRGEIAPKMRYNIIEVTELPTRENAPTEEPTKNLTQGVSLKVSGGGGSSSSTSFYVVVDSFTGEYIDPLVLHKLTDTICYYEGDDILSLLTWNAVNNKADTLPVYQTSTDYNSIIISWWSCYSGNLKAHITYDYQVKFI